MNKPVSKPLPVPGTTWMSTVPAGVQMGVQGTHLIRASINPTGRPQGRVLTQPNSGGSIVTSIAASSASTTSTAPINSLQVSQAGSSAQVTQITGQQQQQQQQTGGQILATVQCPRPQTATLVYSNVGNHAAGQPFGTTGTAAGGAQRLTLSHSRPIRPIQLTATNNRITGTGLRTANISIRPPSNVPGLTTANVQLAGSVLPGQGLVGGPGSGNLVVGGPAGGQQQQQQQGRPGGGPGTANLATRIIQVQAPQAGGGTAQVINTGRIAGNLMTLTPVLSQVASAAAVGGRGGGVGIGGGQMGAGKGQSSLTITHVGKITQQAASQQQQQQSQNQGGHIVVSQAPQQPQTMIVTMGGNHGGPMTTTATTIGHQVMNVVSQATPVSSGGGGTSGGVSVSGTTTMLPLSGIGGRQGATGIVRTLATSQATGGLQASLVTASGTTTLLPLGKVMAQGGNVGGGGTGTGQTIVETQLQQAQQAGSIFIHSRSPNPVQGEWEGEEKTWIVNIICFYMINSILQ